ncbi:TonB-dependent receptor plug domain-containing protein [Woeseia oceani]|uniref:TonB-dependent receptor n=1 Tax=Woeseia oceani TaxID=1548547 RepID=A0A193LCI9_9GAMM|nr:TonB-dependent receptor [Woeseia oceani]ANO50183.1 hypothetical protein BA177_02180 [Woeseia oceani]
MVGLENLLRRIAVGTLTLFCAMQVNAQGAAAQGGEDDQELEEIVVTGSHIRGVQIDGILPVSVISSDDVDAIAPNSGAEMLTTMSQADVSLFEDIGSVDRASIQSARGDVAALNLRGMGSSNTLVLLNGRRIIQHPGTQFEGNVIATTVNTNTVPSRGVQRVEVLSDGASALYGTDATAGVVNTVLMKDFEGLTLSGRYGGAEGIDYTHRTLSAYWGKDFNQGRTNVSVSLNHFSQDGYLATEHDFSRSEDLRPLFEGTPWEGDLQLDNRATYTAWGTFRTIGNVPVSNADNRITTATGQFHIQPNTLPGCRADLPGDICMDDFGISRDQRLDSNPQRSMRPDLERINAFTFINHDLGNGLEFFGEAGTYRGVLERQIEPGWFAPSTTFTVGRNAYWNPFGREFLDDGSPNPNRLPGIDAPAEGLDIELSAYRTMDFGPRIYKVTNNSHRLLGGLRGEWGNWGWESAVLWSRADTEDRTNGISNVAFFEALNRTDATAYNPFNGFCNDDINGVNAVDCTPSPAATIDDITISAYRKNNTEMALADFKMSNGELWLIPGGYVGMALGAEVRRESFEEDRDPRMDGTITYTDTITGLFSDSDLLGMSSTPDFSGSRNIFSAYSELLIPIVSEGMDIPGIESLDMQLAARYEHYSDFGSVLKPKIAIGWHIIESLQIRGSYTEGFSAPALEVVNAPRIVRSSNGIEDNYRCQAGINNGLYADMGDCDLSYGVITPYIGNTNIGPEETTSYAFGMTYQPPFIEGMTLTLNRWAIEQEGIFGGIGVQDTAELDWATRLSTGEAYADVERAPVTQEDIDYYAGSGLEPAGEMLTINRRFLNLESRTTKGVDFGIDYRLNNLRIGDTKLGGMRIKLSAAYLETAYQNFTPLLQLIKDVSEANDSGILVTAAGELRGRDRRPAWRGTATITWWRENWGAGLFARYAGTVMDTSLELDGPELEYRHFMPGTTVNAHVDYRFRGGSFDGLTARIGARNLLDRDPPLADATFGYPAWMASPEGRYLYGQLTYRF